MEQTTTEGAKKRPVFLTVLCILSFIAAGFVIIGGIIGYLAVAAVSAVADGAMAGMEGMEGMGEVVTAASGAGNVLTLLIVGVALTVVALIGVIMMWKLKKTGFYVYTGAQVIGIVVPIVLGSAFPVVGTIITAGFVVMYGLNLKHMS